MSPERARIFWVDDDLANQPPSSFCEKIRRVLEENGHTIVAEAATLDEALLLIPKLHEQGVNVAIVDGNLTEFDISGENGRTVTEKIKEPFGEEIKVVSFSARRNSYGYGDAFVKKDGRNPEKLAEAVTKL